MDRSGHGSGAEAVDLAELAGLFLDGWQEDVLCESLMEDASGRWSAFEVGVDVSRQNGKGSILEARQLAGLFVLHERLQVHTAHEFKTCFEHFLRITQLIESCPELDARVMRVRRGAGEQAVELRGGERLRFVARSGGSGRGMSGDAVYLDEAFALTPAMMGALLPTLSARPNPQVWYTSSAPMSSSTVWHGVRKRAAAQDSPRLLFMGWGNDIGADPADRSAWYRANPALGIRISEDFVEAEMAAMPADEFARERLGVPDPLPEDDRRDVKLPVDRWAATVGPDLPRSVPMVALVFDVDMDSASASLAWSARSLADPYVEVMAHHHGTGWLPAAVVAAVREHKPVTVACNGAGPAGAMVGPVQMALRDAGLAVEVVQQSSREYAQACGGFFADVVEGRLCRPAGQTQLDNAAADATERMLSEAWVWARRQATVPISPLVAVTIARAFLPTEPESKSVFAY